MHLPMVVLVSLLLLTMFSLSLSESTGFLVGSRVSVSVPSFYEPGFHGSAYILKSGGLAVPGFRAALNVEAIRERYVCSLSVLLGEVEVWSSKRLSEFSPFGSCVVELMRDGELQLRDSFGRVGWRTETSGQGIERLELLRTGNLVLIDSQNQTKWESFSYLSNTMLWGQRLSTPASLTALSNNSTWLFTFEIQSEKLALYFNYDKQNYSYWEFRLGRGRKISTAQLGSSGLKLFDQHSKKIAQILSNRSEPVRFLALGTEGSLGFYHYSPQKGKFEASLRVPNDTCDLPLPCGTFGVCTSSNGCSCMKFSSDPHPIISTCGEGLSEGFCGIKDVKMVELDGVTSVLKGTPLASTMMSKDECVKLCMEDCSCAAVLFSDGSSNLTKKGCFQYELVGGFKQVEIETGLNYLVKVARNTTEEKGRKISVKKLLLIVGGTVDGLAILLISGGLVCYFVSKSRRKCLESGNT